MNTISSFCRTNPTKTQELILNLSNYFRNTLKKEEKKYYTSYILSEIEEKTKYFKAHRSYLVNIDHIKELYSWFNGSYKIIINDTDKSEIPVSRNNVRKLKDVIGL